MDRCFGTLLPATADEWKVVIAALRAEGGTDALRIAAQFERQLEINAEIRARNS